jgi:hypothetical protein
VGFVVNKVALGQVFSDYFGFSCQFSFHRLLHIHHHISSEAGKIGQFVADVPSEFSLTDTKKLKKLTNYYWIIIIVIIIHCTIAYQFIVVGNVVIAVPVGEEQQLAVAVEGEVHVKLVCYVGQVIGQHSGFDFGERSRSGVSFGTRRAAGPNLYKASRHVHVPLI